MIRYETREDSGFEILFEGIESIQNLNSEIFEDDGTPTNLESHFDFTPDLLTDKRDNDRKLKKASYTDETLRDLFPEALGIAHSSMAALWSAPPENLEESFFRAIYGRGGFKQDHDDIQNLAACLFHGVDIPSEMKKIWPRYSEQLYQETITKIWAKVHKKSPNWAKKFNRIWEKLTPSQADALKLEWFYTEDEKPTQKENAERLGISIASYQERLEWAYKKLERLYPEFTRQRRKNPVNEDISDVPASLYEVLPSGEKIQIEHPIKKDKILSASEHYEIKRWANQAEDNHLFKYDFYTDIDDIKDEEDKEAEEDEIEQEHEDYLLLKAEKLEQNKGGD